MRPPGNITKVINLEHFDQETQYLPKVPFAVNFLLIHSEISFLTLLLNKQRQILFRYKNENLFYFDCKGWSSASINYLGFHTGGIFIIPKRIRRCTESIQVMKLSGQRRSKLCTIPVLYIRYNFYQFFYLMVQCSLNIKGGGDG